MVRYRVRERIGQAAFFEKLGYRPHPYQQRFHDSGTFRYNLETNKLDWEGARFKSLCGGSRVGKSLPAGMQALWHLMTIPAGRTWIVGPTYSLAEKEFRYILDGLYRLQMLPSKRWSVSNDLRGGCMNIVTPWDYVVECKSADSKMSLLGDEFDCLILSEPAMLDPDAWTKYLAPRAGMRRAEVIANSTPRGRNWYWEKFLQPGLLGDPAYWSEQVSLLDAPHYPREELERRRREDPPEIFREECLGEIVTYSGLVYPEYRDGPERTGGHLETWAALDARTQGKWREWFWFEIIDPGIGAPTAVVWWILEPREGGLPVVHQVDELYQRDAQVEDICLQIHDRRRGLGMSRVEPEMVLMDPSSIRREQTSGVSILDRFCEYGVYPTPADNDIDSGIVSVKSMLHQGRFRLMEHCVHTRREFQSYEWMKYDPNAWAVQRKPARGKDHLMDCVRYGVNSISVDVPGYGVERVRGRREDEEYEPQGRYAKGICTGR